MSDNEIRRILAERKRQDQKMKRRAAALEIVGDIVAWVGLLAICFMLSAIGG
ncbi:MAG: hypothetical protein MJ128_05380 [Mogibacterium sp.]|nr:hypothetical protein [Mogibacterium sp.]